MKNMIQKAMSTVVRFIVVCTITSACLAADRLPRESLLLYRTELGEQKSAQSPTEWRYRKKEILKGMFEVMGEMPKESRRCDLDMKVLEETDAGSYIRRLISYQSEPGSYVPAYLCLPKRSLKPGTQSYGALCLHPTDHQNGHKVVMGLGGREGRQYAHELAERGWITLSPAYPLLANYHPDLKKLGYVSGTMKAIWDNRRGLDLLQSLPNVHPDGFAAIGHSLGGHNAIFTAVLDGRIKVTVTSCGFDSFLDYKGGDIRGWTSMRYMPRLLGYKLEEIPFDFHELIASIAPRSIFVSAPKGDGNFRWQSVQRIMDCARPVFELHDATQKMFSAHPDCGHDFPADMREKAYIFMKNQISNRISDAQ